MSDWLVRFAHELGDAAPSGDEVDAILDLARDVAHGTERKLAPVTSYLVGISVGRRMADGGSRAEALEAAVRDVRGALPEA